MSGDTRLFVNGNASTGGRPQGREDTMKKLTLLGISLIAVSACAPQPPPPPATAAPPPSYAAGSPPAATTYFDGTYIGISPQNQGPSGPESPISPVAPVLTIKNGGARFAALKNTYQGYVTPQ